MSDLIERLRKVRLYPDYDFTHLYYVDTEKSVDDQLDADFVHYDAAATALAEAQAEIARLKDPRTAARLICDEVLQKSSDEAAAMREAMVKATMGTKVPALTGEVRWSVVNDALRALAALAKKGEK